MFNPFKPSGCHFDPKKLKKLYMWIEQVKSIPQIMLLVQPISRVVGKIKFIGIAFEDQ